MTPTDFVNDLARIAPLESDYIIAGLSMETARRLRKSYLCQERKIQLHITESNELLGLMKKWHTGNVEVGMIRLSDEPLETERGVQIGVVEADPLIIVNSTGELVVEESGANGHILWSVAESPGRFLKILIVAAQFLEKCGMGAIDPSDFRIARVTAEECAVLAGGNKYHAFYLMLLGVE